jgi:NADH:ubiquinone oxidoreductase subunit E
LDDLQADLEIVSGGTTADGAVSLESVSCFGACALAPVVILDDKVLRQQTSTSMKKALQDLSSGPSKGRPRGGARK